MTSNGPQRSGSEYPWWASLFTGFAIIVVGLLVLAFIISRSLGFLTAAPTDLGSAVISAGALVFVAVVANFGVKIFERRQQIQQEQRTKKAEIYDALLAFWFGFYLSDDNESSEEGGEAEPTTGKSATDNELNEYMTNYTHQIVTWGSEPVLKEYAAFKEKVKGGGAILEFENLLFAIRRDLGHRNKGLKQGDILKVFINNSDVDEYVGQRTSSS